MFLQFLLWLHLLVIVGSENMVCSKFGFNWAAEIRCLRALLSQCKRSHGIREARKVPHRWSEHPTNYIPAEGPPQFPILHPAHSTTTTTLPPPMRDPRHPDINSIIANMTEHFDNRLRKLKEAMQAEQQERIAILQARLENEIKIAEAKGERKLMELKRKHDSELRKLMKRVSLLATRVYHYGRNDYIFVEERKSWYEAEEDCLAWGGHLTSVLDENENSFIRGILRATSAWIGVNDVQAENAFINTDLTPVNYRNFKDGEPDNANHNENCVEITASGKWADGFCLVTKPFICKR